MSQSLISCRRGLSHRRRRCDRAEHLPALVHVGGPTAHSGGRKKIGHRAVLPEEGVLHPFGRHGDADHLAGVVDGRRPAVVASQRAEVGHLPLARDEGMQGAVGPKRCAHHFVAVVHVRGIVDIPAEVAQRKAAAVGPDSKGAAFVGRASLLDMLGDEHRRHQDDHGDQGQQPPACATSGGRSIIGAHLFLPGGGRRLGHSR